MKPQEAFSEASQTSILFIRIWSERVHKRFSLCQKQPLEIVYKKGVLKIFANVTRSTWKFATLLKRDYNTGICLWNF